MARVYSLLSTKGGCCKSTTAVSLAAYWASRGFRVLLVDADGPQHHAEKWIKRGTDLANIKCLVEPVDVGPVIAANDDQFDVIVVDVIGVDSTVLTSAAAHSDVVIVPMSPTAADTDGALSTVTRLRALEPEVRAKLEKRGDPRASDWSIDYRVMLTRTQPRRRIYRHFKNEVQAAGVPMLKTEWRDLALHAEGMTFGSTPTYLDPKSDAAAEIATLAQELDAIVDAKTGTPAKSKAKKKKETA